MKQAIETARSVIGDCLRVVARNIGNGIEALEAVPPRSQPFFQRRSFAETVSCCRYRRRTDTIASMAGAPSGAYLGEEAISPAWRERAEGARSMG
jgi:ADP-ribosylglycohydrolase